MLQIIGVIGTLAAATAAWRSSKAARKSSETAENQLDEMRKQRIKMYQPSLAFVNNIYEVNTNETVKRLSFYLYNIGFGAAKDIQIKWEKLDFLNYNEKPFLSEEEGLFVLMSCPFSDSKAIINSKSDNAQIIQHCLPTNVNQKPEKINVPLIPTYSILYSVYHELMKQGNKSAITMYELYFTVIYKDINDKEYKEKHQLNMSYTLFNIEKSQINLKLEIKK